MSIRTNIFSLTKLFEDGHIMEISLEFERRAKAYNDLLAENERLRKAGDAMAFNAKLSAYISPRLRQEWEEAKKGRDAK